MFSQNYKPVPSFILAAISVTVLGCATGILSLYVTSGSCSALDADAMFDSYFRVPGLLLLNLALPVLLIWIFYLLSGRGWVGFLGCSLPVMGITAVNYYKIQLRSDPLLASDLKLASEAGNIVTEYSLELTPRIRFALLCLVAGLLLSLLIPRWRATLQSRFFLGASCAALTAVAFPSTFLSSSLYSSIQSTEAINPWSDVEVYVSKGCMYPFLYSLHTLQSCRPEGYHTEQVEQLLLSYPDSDIPEDRKVSVLGVMLEAFCDFTDVPALSQDPLVQEVYAPWHELESRSVTGNLLTNIFAGGTVDTEWGFVTGYSTHSDFRKATDSYVWYLRSQGYQTFGSHPGYSWFYNRQNINGYLGFQEYWFSENHYAELVDPTYAQFHSDGILVKELLRQLKTHLPKGPCFSFSVSLQNHGPYSAGDAGIRHLSEDLPLPDASKGILDAYLNGVQETCIAMQTLAAGLEDLNEPVVLVLFGDHKPWGGNGNTVYQDLGVDLNIATAEGFRNYYSTPYLIWANSAAKETLGEDFVGEGKDLSPCFLMSQVFDLCGWEGPGFMKLAREVRDATPMVHTLGLYWAEDGPVDTLPDEKMELVNAFLQVEYYREHQSEFAGSDS